MNIDIDSTVIAAIIGLAGISLGALLSGLGFFLKLRMERLKNRKSVLFYLLEIRHSIRTEYLDPDEMNEKFISHCKEYFVRKSIPGDLELPNEFKQIISSHFQQVANSVKSKINIEFVKPFNEAVLNLSKDAPVLAYKLQGQEKISKLLSVQQDYMNDLKNLGTVQDNELLKEFMPQKMKSANDSVIAELIDDLDKDIRNVALSCGLFTFIRCWPILRKKSLPEFNFSGLDILLDQLSEDLMSVVQETKKQTTTSTVKIT